MELKPEKVWKNAPAVKDTGDIPSLQVIEACQQWARNKGLPEDSVIDVLQRHGVNKCFCFYWNGTYVGVESDGYIHT